jgi:hypothetical protein
MQQIIIRIDADGETIQIRTAGFVGSACKRATAGLEHDLGTVTSSRATTDATLTPALHVARERARG